MKEDKYEKNIYMAMLAQQCSNYREMLDYLEDIVKQRNRDLSPEERNLLSYGYIKYINSKRDSLHKLMAYETTERKKMNSGYLLYLQEYRKDLETELTMECQKITLAIDSLLFKKAEGIEAKIFYKKLKADINRYMCEYAKDESRERVVKDSMSSYQEAIKLAKDLSLSNALVLGCHLNYCIFFYEVMNERKTAMKMANEIYPKAEKEIEKMDKSGDKYEKYVDAKNVLDLLQKHMDYWQMEENEQQTD